MRNILFILPFLFYCKNGKSNQTVKEDKLLIVNQISLKSDKNIDTIILDNRNQIYSNLISKKVFETKKRFNSIDTSLLIKKNINGELILNFKNNKKLLFRDSLVMTDDTEQKSYTYIGFIKALGLHVVTVQYYETGECLLINEKTGDITKVWSLPNLSPNKKMLATSSSALGYDEMPNGIQLWDVDNNGLLKLKWNYTQTEWSIDDLKWFNNNGFYIHKKIPSYLSKTKKDENSYLLISW